MKEINSQIKFKSLELEWQKVLYKTFPQPILNELDAKLWNWELIKRFCERFEE